MKFIHKSDYKFIDGYIVNDDGDVATIPYNVAHLLEQLDTQWQMYQHTHEQDKFHPAPTLEGFKRIRISDTHRLWQYESDPATPVIDAEVKKTMKMLNECDEIKKVEDINLGYKAYADMLEWLDKPSWILLPDNMGASFVDTPSFNPLELTSLEAQEMIKAIVIERQGYDD